MKKIFFTILFLLFACPFISRASQPASVKPHGFVNDFAGILPSSVKQELETQLSNFEQETTHEISIVTIDTLNGEPIEDYANNLFREWGIGKKEHNNGILFLIAFKDREMRIEVGYGLEGAVTDIETKYIQEDFVKPYFKKGDYASGIKIGAQKIQEAAREELIIPETNNVGGGANGGVDYFFIFYFVIFGFSWLASILGKTKSWWLGGVLGGIFALIIGVIISNFWLVPFGAVIGLIFDYLVSKHYKAGHHYWWLGGGSFGGGGFSGFGGGSSGGGGSSSSW